MISNRHPADELALVRTMMADLRIREQGLRERLIAAEACHALTGAEHVAVLRRSERRVPCPERLPPGLREDPALYRMTRATQVLVKPLDQSWLPAPLSEDDFDVIERF